MAAEVDSREWHLPPEEWQETLRKHTRMTSQGILVLHFTPKQIRTELAQVVAAWGGPGSGPRQQPAPIRTLPATA